MLGLQTMSDVARLMRETDVLSPAQEAELQKIEQGFEQAVALMRSASDEAFRAEVLSSAFDPEVAAIPLIFEVFAFMRESHARKPGAVARRLDRLMACVNELEELIEDILDLRAVAEADAEPEDLMDHSDVFATD